MKIFTLSLVTLFLTTPCVAKNNFSLKSPSEKSPIAIKVDAFKAKRNNLKAIVLNTKSQNGSTAIMLPRQEEEWNYEEEWFKSGDYYYEYDKCGNITKNRYEDEFGATVTDYTYDEYNNVLTSIESMSEEEEPFEYTAKRELTYDNKVTNLITESKSYTWNEDDWLLFSDGHTYKRVITRNDKGAIVSIELMNYYMNEYHLQFRTSITYNVDGLAETWKYEELGYNTSTGDLVMQEKYTLKNMEWYTTDGQILVLDDLTAFFTGDRNRLKKATVYSNETQTGNIEASYKENGDYTYKYIYTTEPYAEEIYTHTLTDENGSFTETYAAYEDIDSDGAVSEEELVESEELNVTIDKYGRVTEETAILDEEEILFSAKYEFTYDEKYGSYPVEQLYTEYDLDTEEYIPFLKIVAKDFIDVTSSINNVISNDTNSTAIYNLQGIKIDTPADKLPAGIYIINKNGKTSKIIKR